MAKNRIILGTNLIRQEGNFRQKHNNYLKAREIFEEVNRFYVTDYLYAFNQYARAFLEKKEYARSLEKLNQAYRIDSDNIEVLNNLGLFFLKVPEEFFAVRQEEVVKFYLDSNNDILIGKRSLDLALIFFKKAFSLDPNNQGAILGLGDSFFQKGDYHQAKLYYKKAILIDENEPFNYKGLLNLALERNFFSTVIYIHSHLHEVNGLSKLPASLLAKWASYYFKKQKQEKINFRIEYGISSEFMIDKEGHLWPAINSILQALKQKEPTYPPFQLYQALVAKENQDWLLLEEKSNFLLENNFYRPVAFYLKGLYHYHLKKPLKARSYLEKSISWSKLEPFEKIDLISKELYQPGEVYFLLGNIYYYFSNQGFKKFAYSQQKAYEKAEINYKKAMAKGYRSAEIYYNLGRINYLQKKYKLALRNWAFFYDQYLIQPTAMMALGNVLYFLGKYEASKGEFFKIISELEKRLEEEKVIDPNREKHFELCRLLSKSYNNLGVLYQRQERKKKSRLHYLKALNYARKINSSNVYAQLNLDNISKKNNNNYPEFEAHLPEKINFSLFN
jgi:tetratricopeptide (TPR) repeat protein